MKRGVVAQLIYMLVLIAIAVVVGLFFMNIVEKNKKNVNANAIAKISFDATRLDLDTILITADKNPADYIQNLTAICYDANNSELTNVSNIEGDFYAQGAGYKYEWYNANKLLRNCTRVELKGIDTYSGKEVVFLNKYLNTQ